MDCRADETDPDTGLKSACWCDDCGSVRAEMRDLELQVARRVGALLSAGWSPAEIVDVVRRNTPRSSRAKMLVRVELACLAGFWWSRRDRSDWIDEAEHAAKGTGFSPGVTIPGWMRHWLMRKAEGERHAVRTAVGELNEALDPLVAVTGESSQLPDIAGRIAFLEPEHADLLGPDHGGEVIDLWDWIGERSPTDVSSTGSTPSSGPLGA